MNATISCYTHGYVIWCLSCCWPPSAPLPALPCLPWCPGAARGGGAVLPCPSLPPPPPVPLQLLLDALDVNGEGKPLDLVHVDKGPKLAQEGLV